MSDEAPAGLEEPRVDLVAPINNTYKIRRDRSRKNSMFPASTFDVQLVAMGIWLKRLLGSRGEVNAGPCYAFLQIPKCTCSCP